MKLLPPQHWKDYELIDTGGGEKLERFGKYVLSRPEPQAVWDKSLGEDIWQKADAIFKREKNAKGDSDKGEWVLKKGMPDRWHLHYEHNGLKLNFRLALTAFKHVGLFPEQATNWDYLFEIIPSLRKDKPKVLNLFAYTGGASLAAKAAGAEVTHVDSVKQVITWARENMEASALQDIRWMAEDAMKFVKREVKRGNRYSGIILDPPAYGRGPEGEKWILEEQINELLKHCHALLEPKDAFLILNMYSMGFSALIAENLVRHIFGTKATIETGEFFIPDRAGNRLPLGIFLWLRQ
ncbi:MAG: class I SAM-dependent methyltransferase [Chitinophagales bacterium]|nr:class I SAM-dependent methyltransferase [Chitinophagales bacterium]